MQTYISIFKSYSGGPNVFMLFFKKSLKSDANLQCCYTSQCFSTFSESAEESKAWALMVGSSLVGALIVLAVLVLLLIFLQHKKGFEPLMNAQFNVKQYMNEP